MSDIFQGGPPPHDSVLPSASSLCLAAAAAAVNEQDILRQSVERGLQEGISPGQFYEGLLQVYLFAGFPAALEGLTTLDSVIHLHHHTDLLPPQEAYDVEAFVRRGEELCKSIYTTAYEKMRKRLGHIAPDLDQWMIIEGYGKTLSRPGLPVKTREMIIVAVLAVTGWHNQLYSHVRGARHVGATREECEDILLGIRTLYSDIAHQQALEIVKNVFEKTYDT